MNDWNRSLAPSLDDFAALAEAAFARLPHEFRRLTGDVEFRIEDFADEETLASLDIEDAFELTGLYHGVDLASRTSFDPAPQPSRVTLYRRPILDEWADNGEVTLGELIEHVLVHEIGHHFGLSDDRIHEVEED
jgi:predicted Zn-dependent protease with MMP-like domain